MKNKIWSSKEKLTLLFMATGILIFAIAVHHQQVVQQNTNPIIIIAKEHLQKYVHNAFSNIDFFSMVKKVEVVEGECKANHYWENWGQPAIESLPKHQCWIIKFYYHSPVEGSYLAVYVDKNTNEVIGGTQTK